MLTVAAIGLASAGYAAADIADVAPGPLTSRALPTTPPPLPEPSVSVPRVGDPVVLQPGSSGPAVVPATLGARLIPLLADPRLGSASASVLDVTTGEQLLNYGADAGRIPASTSKVLTAVAALNVLGADRTFPTSTSLLPAPVGVASRVVLTGGGDALLAAGSADPQRTDARFAAGLGDLAAATAAALPPGTTGVDVVVDDSLLGSPQAFARGSGDTLYYSPPSSLLIDSGFIASNLPRDQAPALEAANAFADGLRAAGIGVGQVGVSRTAVGGGTALAQVDSAPLSQILEYGLAQSDNTVLDTVAGLISREAGGDGTVAAGASAVVDALAGMGIDMVGVTLADGSGLSGGSIVPARVLTAVLRYAGSADDPDARRLPMLLPVAGWTGTLSGRFDTGSSLDGIGVVRAKTGTLTGVSTLAGYTTTLDGRTVAFAVMATPPVGGSAAATDAIDAIATALAGCGCAT